MTEYEQLLDKEVAKFLYSTPASRLSQIEEFFNEGLLSPSQAREFLDIPPYFDIETRVSMVRIEGREVFEWVT